MKTGRPSIYTQELAEKICFRVSNGEALKDICADPDMPCATQVRKWNVENRNGFALLYARAREARADYWAEEIIEIADSVRQGATSEEVQAAKLASDNRKWTAARLLPKQYGDRMEHVGAGGKDLIPEQQQDPQRIALALLALVHKVD